MVREKERKINLGTKAVKDCKFYKAYESFTEIKAENGEYLPLPERATGENDFRN